VGPRGRLNPEEQKHLLVLQGILCRNLTYHQMTQGTIAFGKLERWGSGRGILQGNIPAFGCWAKENYEESAPR
jgi:hypothetical protein